MAEDDTRTMEHIDAERDALKSLIAEKLASGEATEAETAALIRLNEERENFVDSSGRTISAIDAEAAALKAATASGTELAKGLGKLIGINKDFNDTLAGQLSNMMSSTVAQGKFKEQLKKTFHPANLINNVMQKMIQSSADLAISTDRAMVNFNKSTGALRMYQHQMVNLEKEQFRNNITIEDVAESYGSMVRNVGNLHTMSGKSQKSLALTTATLQELGVDADTTTSNINSLTMGLGMSMDQATKTQREMFVLAQAMGKPPSEMSKEFNAALPRLAAFGNKSADVFNKMARNAKAAGMSVDAMLRITEKFDEFGSAADSVGKLNAVLGGPYLSSLEMLRKTDPTDRMKMLSDATRQAGKSFDTMGYYERKATADAMGLSDVNELALVMAGKFNLVGDNVAKTSSEIEALALQTQEFNTVADVGRQVMRMFAVQMGPVIMGIKKMLGGFIQLVNYFPVVKVAFAALAVAISIAMTAIAVSIAIASGGTFAAFQAATAAISAFIIAVAMLYSYLGNLGDIFDSTNLTMSALKLGLLLIVSAAMPLIGIIYALIQVFVYWNDIMAYIGKILEPLQPRFEELTEAWNEMTWSAGEGAGVWKAIGAFFMNQLADAILTVGTFLIELAESITLVVLRINHLWNTSKAFRALIYGITAGLATAIVMLNIIPIAIGVVIVLIIKLGIWVMKLVSWLYSFSDGFTALKDSITAKHSLSLGEALQWVIDLMKTMGTVFKAPVKAIGSLITKLKQLGKLLSVGGIAGKAFGYLSSFFGGGDVGISATATTKTIGGGGVQGADKARRDQQRENAETIGKEVGRQVTLALNARDKDRVQQIELMIESKTSLSNMFDFFAKGMERRLAGKSSNFGSAADAASSGLSTSSNSGQKTRSKK